MSVQIYHTTWVCKYGCLYTVLPSFYVRVGMNERMQGIEQEVNLATTRSPVPILQNYYNWEKMHANK